MQHLIEEAKRLANHSGSRLSTLHLCLEMVVRKGPAGKLLVNSGLTESKLRSALRGGAVESEHTLKRVLSKAKNFATSFQVREPSEMHLLAAMLTVSPSAALRALESDGVNVNAMRTQALRSLTRTANQFAEGRQRSLPLGADYAVALPLMDPLGALNLGQRRDRNAQVSSPQKQRSRCKSSKPFRADALRSVGLEIEQKQRNRHLLQQKALTGDAAGASLPPIAAPARARASHPNTEPSMHLSADRFPLLSSLGRNLNALAAEGHIEPIIGRDREMAQLTDVLNKRRANCPIVIGPAGVGKTALIEGLALRLAQGNAPGIRDAVIVEVRPSDLLAGTSVRGALAERLDQLQKEVSEAAGGIVLFFDELHALLSSTEGAEAIRELKNAIGRGSLPCIAATGDEEYVKYVENDPALVRRFTKVELTEPDENEAIRILEGIIQIYSDHHSVAYTEAAVRAAVGLSARYITERALPDKAISLIDTAGARVRRHGGDTVDADDIAHVVAEQLAIPPERLTASDHERLLNLEASLAGEVVGHGHVLKALGETLRRNAAGFRTGRPIGTFLFLGPTGVGKTETAKSLGGFLFPSKGAFIRLDMSEFSEAHAVARLIGAPPGYVGHEEGGQLTEAVRRRPYSLVLLDEIEKAHPEVLQILLQVLDDGRLTDGMGRTVVFENTIIVMTSNLGCALREERRRVGFGAKREVAALPSIKDTVLGAVRESLPPELWNRLDELLVFEPLTRDDVLEIASRMIQKIGRQLEKEKNIGLKPGQGLLETLADAGGFDPEYGARPMRRTIQRLVEGPVARLVLEGGAGARDTIIARGVDGSVLLEVMSGTSSACSAVL